MKPEEVYRTVGAIVVGMLLLYGGMAFFQVVSKPPFTEIEWPAWVQAVGAIAAIYFAGWQGNRQARRQFEDAARLQRIAVLQQELRSAAAMVELSEWACIRTLYLIKAMNWTRETFHEIASSKPTKYIDLLEEVEYALNGISLHDTKPPIFLE